MPRGLANAEQFYFPAGFGRLSVSVIVDSDLWKAESPTERKMRPEERNLGNDTGRPYAR